ncbi:MAG: WD40 repeat domain-containing protein [Saprospiraceae bacterium]|nr:WD40 repeat domain-containing protein [Saprospiraceae bacterium]
MEIKLQHICTGHRAALYALSTGYDERHVRSAGGDGWIVEWNLDEPETGRVIATTEGRIFSLCSWPQKGKIACGDMNGGLHWIDLLQPERGRDIAHHQKGVYDLLPLGAHLLSAGGDGVLSKWDLGNSRAMESLQLSAQALRCLAYSPARRELAVGSSDNSIYLLDPETFAIRHTLPQAHQNSVFTLSYRPDGRYLLSGGRDAMLRVWDLEAGCSLHSEQAAHWYTINHIVFSPDGRFFATASRDKTIKIWDADNFSLLKVIDTIRHGGHVNSVNRLLWLPDVLISCSDDSTLKIWAVEA